MSLLEFRSAQVGENRAVELGMSFCRAIDSGERATVQKLAAGGLALDDTPLEEPSRVIELLKGSGSLRPLGGRSFAAQDLEALGALRESAVLPRALSADEAVVLVSVAVSDQDSPPVSIGLIVSPTVGTVRAVFDPLALARRIAQATGTELDD